MKARVLVAILAVYLGAPVFADGTWTWESAWTARELWSGTSTTSGAEAWVLETGLGLPRVWSGLGAGFDLGIPAAGSPVNPQPQGLARLGYSVPVAGIAEVVPWVGGAAGLNLLAVEGGFDTEFRVWGSHFLVVGLEFRSDGAFGVSAGFRDRTSVPLPSWGVSPPGPLLVTMAPDPLPFDPDGESTDSWLHVRPGTDAPWRVQHWAWSVTAPENEVFLRKSGVGPLPWDILWDGFSTSGELVSSATDYTLDLEVWDDYGRLSSTRSVVTTDILVVRVGDRYLIRLPAINFQADSPDLVVSSQADQNLRVIQRLAEILKRYPQYSITVEGHANLVHWNDPVRAREENLRESKPLSLRRSQTVKDALTALGLDPLKIRTKGAGGDIPLFPFGDPENSWKNRRVDIYLDKPATGY